MQVSRFEVNTMMGSTYQYHPDGRIKFVDDISMETPASDKFDRSYVYDHVGRLIEAKSGTEAHTPSVTTDDRPYRETFGFDEWNNPAARTGRVWADDMLPMSAQYTDNRRQGWTYDADGRPVLEDTLEHKYDASGRKYWSKDTAPHAHFSPGLTISQGFDGEGQRLKQTENNSATYLISSSALGGEVVWEIGKVNNIWQKKTGFVYGAGRMLATQTLGLFGNQQIVTWRYQNPVTGSQRGLEPTELDPLGLNAGLAAAEEGPPGGGEAPDLVFPRYGDILNGSTGCTQDGAMASCDQAASGNGAGAIIVLPEGVSTIDLVIDRDTGIIESRDGSLEIDQNTGEARQRRRWVRDEGRKLGPAGNDPIRTDPDGIEVVEVNTDFDDTSRGHWEYFPSRSGPRDDLTACGRMANDAQRIAVATKNEYPKATAAWALQEFNKTYGEVTFGSYFAETPLGFIGTPASSRNDALGNRSYQGDSGFPEQFRDTLKPGDDQVHHFGAYFSAGLAGHKLIPDQHRADDRRAGNMGDVRLTDQSRRLGDYLRRNPSQLSNVGRLIETVICGAGEVL